MSIFIIALGAWTAFALLRFVVVPRADRKAARNRDISGIGAAAVSSLSGFLSFASLMVAIGTTAALSVLAYVNAIGGTTLQEARDALLWIQEIEALLANFDARIGIATTIVLILAFAYHAYRSGGMRLRSALKAHIDQELSRLEDEDLEELPLTQEMETLAGAIESLQGHLAELNESHPARRQLLSRLHELVAQYHTEDLLRRIDTNLTERETEVESAFGRVLLFCSSAGMLRSLTGLGRLTVAAGLLLLIPTSMTVGLSAIQDATDERVIAVNKTIAQLEFELLLTNSAQEPLSPDDEQAIDAIASVFESELVQARYLQDASALQASDEIARATARTRARNLILEASGSHPTAPSQSVRSSSFEPLEQRVLALNAEATGRRRPVTTYGERLRADLRDAVPQMDRAIWADLRSKVGDYVRLFRQAPNPRDVRAMMLSDVFGYGIDRVDADGPVLQRMLGVTSELTGEVAEGAYIAESRRYLVELARSQDVTQALSNLSRAPQATMPAAMAQARRGVGNIPAPQDISARPSSLAVTSRPGVDEAAAQRAVRRIAQIRGIGSASVGDNLLGAAGALLTSADVLVSFGDLFPGQLDEPVNSVRGRTVRELAPRASRANVDRKLRAGYARARNYTRLRGFSRVGGVVLGRPPQSGTSMVAEELDWRVAERELVLRLIRSEGFPIEIGRYDPAIVHNALAYAADGRVIAVTMVRAEPLPDLRILLHPALVDAGLGCSAIRLDQLVDGASARNQSLLNHRAAAITNVFRQHTAYARAWAIRMHRLVVQHETNFRRLGDLGEFLIQAYGIADPEDAFPYPTEEIKPELPITDFGFLSLNPEFYDQRLVNAISRCGSSESVMAFDGCIRTASTADVYGRDFYATWAAPPPEFDRWSGVREQPWAVDEALSFMTSQEPLGPFRFMVQIAFTSSPWFISEGRWYADNAVLESFDDETPYEITSLEQPLMDEIASHAEQDAETARVLARMAEFTHLQRLFRAALDGQLVLTGMDLEDLAGLAIETAPYVNRSETLRWLPGDYSIEELARKIIAPDNATADSLVTTLRNQIAGLKESLGLDDEQIALAISQGVIPLDEQMALAIGLGEQMCPAPGTFP